MAATSGGGAGRITDRWSGGGGAGVEAWQSSSQTRLRFPLFNRVCHREAGVSNHRGLRLAIGAGPPSSLSSDWAFAGGKFLRSWLR